MPEKNFQEQITMFLQELEKNNFYYAITLLQQLEKDEKNKFFITTMYSHFWDKLGVYLLSQVRYSKILSPYKPQTPNGRINEDQIRNQYQTFLREKNPRIVGSVSYDEVERIKHFLRRNGITKVRLIGENVIFVEKTKVENIAEEIKILLHNLEENNIPGIVNQLGRIVQGNRDEDAMIYTLLGYFYQKNGQMKESRDSLEIASFLVQINFRLDDLYYIIEALKSKQQSKTIKNAKEKAEKHYPLFLNSFLATEHSITDILNSLPISEEEKPLILLFLVKDLYLTRLESQAQKLSKKIEKDFPLTDEARRLLEHTIKQRKVLQSKGDTTELSENLSVVTKKLKGF